MKVNGTLINFKLGIRAQSQWDDKQSVSGIKRKGRSSKMQLKMHAK